MSMTTTPVKDPAPVAPRKLEPNECSICGGINGHYSNYGPSHNTCGLWSEHSNLGVKPEKKG
jgi:hypothetical protein